MRQPILIYCLWCPVSKKIRYIGKSNQPKRRLLLHLRSASHGGKHHTARWLRKLIALNKLPKMKILYRVLPDEDWRLHERRLIALALKKGLPLTNQSAGGDGVEYLSLEDAQKAKLARAIGLSRPDVRIRKSESAKLAWANPSIRAKIIANQKLAVSDPEKTQRRISGLKAASSSLEARKRLSRAAKSRTPEGEARRLAAVKAYWSNPTNRAKQAELTRIANRLKGHL